MAKRFIKDEDALLDYKVAWDEFLNGDEVLSAVAFTDAIASAQASGLRVANTSISAGKSVIVWLSAGVPDNEYTVTVRVWTSAGRRNDDCFTILIEAC